MNDISSIGRSDTGPIRSNGRANHTRPAQANGRARGHDQVQLSSMAKMLSKLREVPDVRQNLVDRVQSQIQAGTYETPARMDIALAEMENDLL